MSRDCSSRVSGGLARRAGLLYRMQKESGNSDKSFARENIHYSRQQQKLKNQLAQTLMESIRLMLTESTRQGVGPLTQPL